MLAGSAHDPSHFTVSLNSINSENRSTLEDKAAKYRIMNDGTIRVIILNDRVVGKTYDTNSNALVDTHSFMISASNSTGTRKYHMFPSREE